MCDERQAQTPTSPHHTAERAARPAGAFSALQLRGYTGSFGKISAQQYGDIAKAILQAHHDEASSYRDVIFTVADLAVDRVSDDLSVESRRLVAAVERMGRCAHALRATAQTGGGK